MRRNGRDPREKKERKKERKKKGEQRKNKAITRNQEEAFLQAAYNAVQCSAVALGGGDTKLSLDAGEEK